MQSEVVIHLLQEKSGEQPPSLHNNGGEGYLILQDGSNCSNQLSVLSSISCNGSDTSHALFSRLSVDTTTLQQQLLIKSKSQAQQIIGTGNNDGLGGINSKGGEGEVIHLEVLRLTNLLSSDNKDQLVKGTAVDKEFDESQIHHSFGEYIQGFGSTLSNAYCNAVCVDKESSSSTYSPKDFGMFYVVVQKMFNDVCIYLCGLCWHLTLSSFMYLII